MERSVKRERVRRERERGEKTHKTKEELSVIFRLEAVPQEDDTDDDCVAYEPREEGPGASAAAAAGAKRRALFSLDRQLSRGRASRGRRGPPNDTSPELVKLHSGPCGRPIA